MDFNILMKKLIKNIIQKLIAFILILVTFPIQIIIAVIIFIELKEFPLYFQKRAVTLEKDIFTLIKFKTISNVKAKKISHDNVDDIFYISNEKIKLTKFAKFLRKTGLDELPQLYNVFFGQLNFIGPRPLMIEELQVIKNSFPSFYETRNKIQSKPGITGLWQVFGDRKKGIENLIGLDTYYENSKSFFLDLKIIGYTIILLLTGNNSDTLSPRLHFISNLFSFSLLDVKIIDYNKHKGKIIYSIQIPEHWWIADDSISDSEKLKEEKPKLRLLKNSHR